MLISTLDVLLMVVRSSMLDRMLEPLLHCTLTVMSVLMYMFTEMSQVINRLSVPQEYVVDMSGDGTTERRAKL